MSAKQENQKILIHGVGNGVFIKTLKERGVKEAFVMEGRPHLDGAKILCKTLLSAKIIPTLISDNMAGFLFYKNFIKEIWTAYQTSDVNGAVCDVGALTLGILGKRHGVVLNLFPSAKRRSHKAKPTEITRFESKRIAPAGVKGFVPLLESIPQKYITGIRL